MKLQGIGLLFTNIASGTAQEILFFMMLNYINFVNVNRLLFCPVAFCGHDFRGVTS